MSQKQNLSPEENIKIIGAYFEGTISKSETGGAVSGGKVISKSWTRNPAKEVQFEVRSFYH